MENLPSIIIEGEQLSVESCVRYLPGKRIVYKGCWQGKEVYCKIYQDDKRAKVHWQREVDGIRALTKAEIPTASLLYAGYVEYIGQWVVLLQEIPRAITLKDMWNSLESTEDKLSILTKLADILIKHHKQGILQKDMHLDNFVFSNGTIYTLDGAGIKSESRSISLNRSINNLALLLAQLTPKNDLFSGAVLQHYMSARMGRKYSNLPDGAKNSCRGMTSLSMIGSKFRWGDTRYSPDIFKLRIKRFREHRLREYMGKILRNCSNFLQVREGRTVAVIDRAFDSCALKQLIADPDASLKNDIQLLKNGNTCTVWKVNLEGLTLVIKRYNVKSLLHQMKLLLKPSRAITSWKNSHMLKFFGISTPDPVALVWYPNKARSSRMYFIYEYVNAPPAYHWFNDSDITFSEKENMAHKVVALLTQMKQECIRHSDLKATNILVRKSPVIIDLDGIRRYRWKWLFDNAWRRSNRRFMKNWKSNQSMSRLFSRIL